MSGLISDQNPFRLIFIWGGGGQGGGGTLFFSAYVGSDPASTVLPKKYQKFEAPQNNI